MTKDSVSKICEFWQQGSHEPTRFNGEDLRSRMNKFERTIRRRNLREYVAAGLVIGVFAYYDWVFPTLLLRIGCGLLILGTAYVAYQLHRKASARPAPAEMGLRNCVQFQRSELERQRDALRAVWSWYLSPFLPGMSLFLLGLFQFTKNVTEAAGRPFNTGAAVAGLTLVAGCVGMVFVAIWLLNRRAANELQKQIDDLDRLAQDAD
jgi:hypothetical protein